MTIEYFDESQGKPIEALEETMILDDKTSYFLTTLDNITRKINLINIAKALCGDEEGENSEFKFYTTKAIKEKFIQVYSEIASVEGIYEKYDEILENLRTNIDTSLKRLEIAIENIDPKIKAMYDRLVDKFETEFERLDQSDDSIKLRIEDIYNELAQSDLNIKNQLEIKFNELTGMIDQNGDLADSLYNILNANLQEIRQLLDERYNELRSQDIALGNRISSLENRADNTNNKFNSYYDSTQIDNKLKDIYDKFKVKIINTAQDSAGRANNLNNYTESGTYFFATASRAYNMPGSCVDGILNVVNCDNGFIKQMFFRLGTINVNDHEIYIRSCWSGTWSSWAKTFTSKDILMGTSVPSALQNGQIYIQYFN